MVPGQPSENKNTILILGARRAQVPAIRAGLGMGLEVAAIDPDPAAPGLTLATHSHVYDLADQDALLAVARENRVDGIMTMAADFPMPTVAAICETLNLPGPLPGVVASATNKRLMRMALTAAGVACPRFIHVDSVATAKQATADLGVDTIFKPAMSHGGRGVTRVAMGSSDEAVAQAFQRALRETRMDGVLVEELVEGPEFSVETLTHRGITRVVAVTDKHTSGPPYFVELGHHQPSRWPADQVEVLRVTAVQAVEALGIDQAAGHTEIRLTSQGPIVIEVAARLGGGFINSHLVPLSTGVDLVAATIMVAIGATPDFEPRTQGHAAAIRFLSAQPGIVTHVEGLNSARHIEGVEEIEVYARPDDQIHALVDASGRSGHVICSAQGPEQAIALAERAMQSIRIVTEPIANER